MSRKRSVQKGLQAPAVEVDAAGDVAVDGGDVWVLGPEGVDLALEVRRLLARGDADRRGLVGTNNNNNTPGMRA